MKYAKTRLSTLMFLQFFVAGATLPILSLYFKDCLNFTGTQVGLILGLSAVSSIVSPVFMAFIADRRISSERLLCLLNLIGGVCMVIFAAQTEFYPALTTYILYSVAMNPTAALINAITFRHSPVERSKFGNIRMWGTVGWIAVAWIFGFVILRNGNMVGADNNSSLPLLLHISAVMTFVTAAYALTIPKKHDLFNDETNASSSVAHAACGDGDLRPHSIPVDKKSSSYLWDAAAFKIMMYPKVLAISLISAAVTFSDKFYSVGTAPFLKQIGFSERSIMPAMSLGQIPEIFAMGILAYLLKRWGAKVVVLAGMAMKIFRFGVCAFFEADTVLIYASLSAHGLAYTFTMVTAIICLDGYCNDRQRAGVHQLFAVLTAGIGGFAGSWAAGWVIDVFTGADGIVNYSAFWVVAFVLAIIITAAAWIAWPHGADKRSSLSY